MHENGTAEQRVIWFSGESWDRDGGTHRAMATAVAEYAPVLWVDPPTSPVTRHRTQRGIKPVLEHVTDRIARLTPVVLPGFTRLGVRIITPALVRAQARWAIRELGIRPNAVVMLYLGGLLGGWGEGITNVMYGTDDYVAGAHLMRVSAGHTRRRERQALSKADIVVGVSPDLAQRWSGMGAKTVMVPNGCWPLADVADRPPAREIDLPKPVVGLVGRLSDRVDFDVLEAIADSGRSLLIIGPRDPHWEPDRFHGLTSKPSVRYIGPVHSAEVPGYLAAIDVGITPYKDTAFNRASFPLKTLEYLSFGVPVITADLPAMRWLRADLTEILPADLADQVLTLADSSQDYLRAISAVAAGDTETMRHRIAFAQRHSWAKRAEQFVAEAGLTPVVSQSVSAATQETSS